MSWNDENHLTLENVPSSNDRDSFCWKCHKKCDNEVDCSKCSLTFHMRCLSNSILLTPSWQCPECEQLTECLNEERKLDNINELLNCAIRCIIRDNDELMDEKFQIPENYSESLLLVYPITLMDIKQKAKNGQYNCTSGLLLDIKWLYHNCIILINESRGRGLIANKLRSRAKKLLEKSVGQISWLKSCVECYTRTRCEFLMPCSKPHLLLWVRYDGEYWPAKLMHIGPDTTVVDVQFFAEFSSAEVPVDDCYLFSQSDPNSWRKTKQTTLFKKAFLDAHEHVKQIELKFGNFIFAPAKTKLVIANIEKHLDDMVPGYRHSSKRPKNEQIDSESHTPNESPQHLQHQHDFDIIEEEPNDQHDDQAVNVERCPIGTVDTLPNKNEMKFLRSESEEYIRTLEENYQLLQKKHQQLQKEHQQLQQENQRQNFKIQNLEHELVISSKALDEQRKQFIRRQQEERAERAALELEEPMEMENQWK